MKAASQYIEEGKPVVVGETAARDGKLIHVTDAQDRQTIRMQTLRRGKHGSSWRVASTSLFAVYCLPHRPRCVSTMTQSEL